MSAIAVENLKFSVISLHTTKAKSGEGAICEQQRFGKGINTLDVVPLDADECGFVAENVGAPQREGDRAQQTRQILLEETRKG